MMNRTQLLFLRSALVCQKQKVLNNFSRQITSQCSKFALQTDKELEKRVMQPEYFKENQLFISLFNKELSLLKDLFEKYKYELRLAGGPVRDLLLEKRPDDLDFATTATPDQMKSMFENEGIRMINNLGEKHGTVTARINDEVNYEITTLRIDKLNDGRRPKEVEFTEDWYQDANRRDLTINSMFVDLKGNLFDYFNGQEDLKRCRVVFVGNAETRIKEDYLRILRYFRFFGKIHANPEDHEAGVLKTIKENASGLQNVSGERIWMEWKKILSGNCAFQLTEDMIKCGLAPHIGLPKEPNLKRFSQTKSNFHAKENDYLHPISKLSMLLDSVEEMMNLHRRLKLSGLERDLGIFLIEHRDQKFNLKFCQDLLVDSKNQKGTNLNICEALKLNQLEHLITELREWEIPQFPVTGHDLKEKGCPKGPIFSVLLTKLKNSWKESNFLLEKEELLDQLEGLIDNLDSIKAEIQPKQKRLKK